MSAGAGGAFGGSRGLRPAPPEKGVFPLDHFGECKKVMKEYMDCLKGNSGQSDRCREVAKVYLECRMDRNLMAKQDLEELGFDKADAQKAEDADPQLGSQERKESTGFVAGIRKKK